MENIIIRQDLITIIESDCSEFLNIAKNYLTQDNYKLFITDGKYLLTQALSDEYSLKYNIKGIKSKFILYFLMDDLFTTEDSYLMHSLFADELGEVLNDIIEFNAECFTDRISNDIVFPAEFIYHVHSSLIKPSSYEIIDKWYNWLLVLLESDYPAEFMLIEEIFINNEEKIKTVIAEMLNMCYEKDKYIIKSKEDFIEKELDTLIAETCKMKGKALAKLYMDKLDTLQQLNTLDKPELLDMFCLLDKQFNKLQQLYLEVVESYRNVDSENVKTRKEIYSISKYIMSNSLSLLKDQINFIKYVPKQSSVKKLDLF